MSGPGGIAGSQSRRRDAPGPAWPGRGPRDPPPGAPGREARYPLDREWAGALQRVMVLEQGVAWNGVTYDSLSQVRIARTF